MKMSEFGEEKVLSQGQPRRTGGLCLPKLQTPEEFQQSILKGKVRERCGLLLQTLSESYVLAAVLYVRSRCSFKSPS